MKKHSLVPFLRSFVIAVFLLGSSTTMLAAEIEEIIVTAEKRDVDLQDIALSVSVLKAEQLEQLYIYNPIDLGDQIPGLNIAKSESRRILSIRGVGNESPQNAGARPGVAYHIDGIFIANDQALRADLLDVERIEVVRGPQGTVFGQNATGGTINVISKLPDFDDVSGYADVALGNYSSQNLRGGVNLPLSDSMAVRVAYSHREHEGYMKNLAIPGLDMDNENSDTFRGQFLWQITDNFTAHVTYQNFDSKANGPGQKSILDFSSTDPREASHDLYEKATTSNDIFSTILTWKNDSLVVKGLFSYQEVDIFRRADMDRTALTANDPAPLTPAVPGVITRLGEAPIREADNTLEQFYKNYTAELNISSAGDRRLDWILGAFFLNAEVNSITTNFGDFGRDGDPLDLTLPTPVVFANPDLDFVNDDIRRRDSYSVFGQGTFHLTDGMRLTAGVRYTEDSIDNDACSFQCRIGQSPPRNDLVDDAQTTGKLAIEFDVGGEGMTYASATSGYKPGGANSTFNDLVPATYEAETVNAFELGYKNRFREGRLQLNTAVFFYDYQNFQFQANAAAPFSGGTANVPKSEVYGAEVELTSLLTDNLRLDWNVSYLKTRIKSDTLVLDSVRAEDVSTQLLLDNGGNVFDPLITVARATAIQNVNGNELSKSPEFTTNVRLTHTAEIGDGATLTSFVSYTHRGQFYYRMFNNPATDLIDSYDIWTLNFRYNPGGDAKWFGEFILYNMFDEDAVNSRFTDNFGVAATSEEFLAPRLVQLRAGFSF
jgi:iron complex outermembrane recepter protein